MAALKLAEVGLQITPSRGGRNFRFLAWKSRKKTFFQFGLQQCLGHWKTRSLSEYAVSNSFSWLSHPFFRFFSDFVKEKSEHRKVLNTIEKNLFFNSVFDSVCRSEKHIYPVNLRYRTHFPTSVARFFMILTPFYKGISKNFDFQLENLSKQLLLHAVFSRRFVCHERVILPNLSSRTVFTEFLPGFFHSILTTNTLIYVYIWGFRH